MALVLSLVLVVFPASGTSNFGFISLKTAESDTNSTLTESNVTAANTSGNYTITRAEEVRFNGSSSQQLMIVVAQFSNSTGATKFYNNELKQFSSISMNTGNYKGYSYEYYTYSYSSYYYGVSLGHAGNFVFVIMDVDLPVTSFSNLVQAQISAMA